MLFENHLLSSSTLSSKSNNTYSKKCANKCVCFSESILNLMKMDMKKRSHRYDINRLRPRNVHSYTKYKMGWGMMMLIYMYQATTKRHLKLKS